MDLGLFDIESRWLMYTVWMVRHLTATVGPHRHIIHTIFQESKRQYHHSGCADASNWCHGAKVACEKLGFSDMWHHPGAHDYTTKENKQKFAEALKQRTRWHTAETCRKIMMNKPHLNNRHLLFQGYPTFAGYWEDPPSSPNRIPLPNSRRRTGTRLCAMLRAGSLPLQVCSKASQHRRENQRSTTCPVCYQSDETPQHFLLECPLYDDIRRRFPNRQRDPSQVLNFKGGEELDMLTAMWSKRQTFLEQTQPCT